MFAKDRFSTDRRSDRKPSDCIPLRGIKTSQDNGSTSFPASSKPMSKYNILHSYFECNFSDDSSKMIAQEFKRQIKSRIKDPSFIDELRNKLIYLHNYNRKVAEVSFTYPFSTELAELLLQYVLMESRTLYRRHYYTGRNEIKTQDRILRLLLQIYNAYFESKSVPAAKIFEKSAKAIINMFIEIRRDYGLNNALLENMTKILLKKMGHLEKIEALKGKRLPCPLDTCLKNDQISEIYRNTTTSDYGTDDGSSTGFQIDDESEDVQIISDVADLSKETGEANEESTDKISPTLSRPVLTICLDFCGPGSDEESACITEEVKPTAEQEKKAIERTLRIRQIQEENQKKACQRLHRIQKEFRERNHKPMGDVKEEDIINIDLCDSDKTFLTSPFSSDKSVMISEGSPYQLNSSKVIYKSDTFLISDEDECVESSTSIQEISDSVKTIDGNQCSSSNSIKESLCQEANVFCIDISDDEDIQAKETSILIQENQEDKYDSFTKKLASDIACHTRSRLNSNKKCTSETEIGNTSDQLCEEIDNQQNIEDSDIEILEISTELELMCNEPVHTSSELNDQAENSVIEILDDTVSDTQVSSQVQETSTTGNTENILHVPENEKTPSKHMNEHSLGRTTEFLQDPNSKIHDIEYKETSETNNIDNTNIESGLSVDHLKIINLTRGNEIYPECTTSEEVSSSICQDQVEVASLIIDLPASGIEDTREQNQKKIQSRSGESTSSIDQSETIILSSDDSPAFSTVIIPEESNTCEEVHKTIPHDQVVAYSEITTVPALESREKSDQSFVTLDIDNDIDKSALPDDTNRTSITPQFSTESKISKTSEEALSIILQDQLEASSGTKEISIFSSEDKAEENDEESHAVPDNDDIIETSNLPMNQSENINLTNDAVLELPEETTTCEKEISTISQHQVEACTEFKGIPVTRIEDKDKESVTIPDNEASSVAPHDQVEASLENQEITAFGIKEKIGRIDEKFPIADNNGIIDSSSMSINESETITLTSDRGPEISTVFSEESLACDEASPTISQDQIEASSKLQGTKEIDEESPAIPNSSINQSEHMILTSDQLSPVVSEESTTCEKSSIISGDQVEASSATKDISLSILDDNIVKATDSPVDQTENINLTSESLSASYGKEVSSTISHDEIEVPLNISEEIPETGVSESSKVSGNTQISSSDNVLHIQIGDEVGEQTNSETDIDLESTEFIKPSSEHQVILESHYERHTKDSSTTNQEEIPDEISTAAPQQFTLGGHTGIQFDHSIIEHEETVIQNSLTPSLSVNQFEDISVSVEDISLSEQPIVPIPVSHVEVVDSSETVSEDCLLEEVRLSTHIGEEICTNDVEDTAKPQSDFEPNEDNVATDVNLGEQATVAFQSDTSKNNSGEFTFDETLVHEVEIVETVVKEHFDEDEKKTFDTDKEFQPYDEIANEVKESEGISLNDTRDNNNGNIVSTSHLSDEQQNYMHNKISDTSALQKIVLDIKSSSHHYDRPKIDKLIEKYSNVCDFKIQERGNVSVNDSLQPLDLSKSQFATNKQNIENNAKIESLGSQDHEIVNDLNLHSEEIVATTSKPTESFSISQASNMLLLASAAEVISKELYNTLPPRTDSNNIRRKKVLNSSKLSRKKQSPKKIDRSKLENKRVTRSQSTKPLNLANFSPPDVLFMKSYSLSTANKVYTQKLSDISLTSEESNDSESNRLLIDEDVCAKSVGKKNQAIEAVQVEEIKDLSEPQTGISELIKFQGETNTFDNTLDENLHFGVRSETTVSASTLETEDHFSQFPIAEKQLQFSFNPHIASLDSSISESFDEINNKLNNSRFKTPGQRKLYSLGPNLYVNIHRIDEDQEDLPDHTDEIEKTTEQVQKMSLNNSVSKAIDTELSKDDVINNLQSSDVKQGIDIDELPLAKRIQKEGDSKLSRKNKNTFETCSLKLFSSSSINNIPVSVETYPVNPQTIQVEEHSDINKRSESEIKNYYILPKLRDKDSSKRLSISQIDQPAKTDITTGETTSPPDEKYLQHPKLRRKSSSATKKDSKDDAKNLIWKCRNTVSPTTEKLMKKLYHCDSPFTELKISDKTEAEKTNEGVKVLIVDKYTTENNHQQMDNTEVSTSTDISSESNLEKNKVGLEIDSCLAEKKTLLNSLAIEEHTKLDGSVDNGKLKFGVGDMKIQAIEGKVKYSILKDTVNSKKKKCSRRKLVSAISELSLGSKILPVSSNNPTIKQNTIADSSNDHSKKHIEITEHLGSDEAIENDHKILEKTIISGPETGIVKEIVWANVEKIEVVSIDQSNNIEKSTIVEVTKTPEIKSRTHSQLGENILSNLMEKVEDELKSKDSSDDSKMKFIPRERKRLRSRSCKETEVEIVQEKPSEISISKTISKSQGNRVVDKKEPSKRDKQQRISGEKKQSVNDIKRKSKSKLESCNSTILDREPNTIIVNLDLKRNNDRINSIDDFQKCNTLKNIDNLEESKEKKSKRSSRAKSRPRSQSRITVNNIENKAENQNQSDTVEEVKSNVKSSRRKRVKSHSSTNRDENIGDVEELNKASTSNKCKSKGNTTLEKQEAINLLNTKEKCERPKNVRSRSKSNRNNQSENPIDENLKNKVKDTEGIERSRSKRKRSRPPSISTDENRIILDKIELPEKKTRKSSSDSKEIGPKTKSQETSKITGNQRRKSISKSISNEKLKSDNTKTSHAVSSTDDRKIIEHTSEDILCEKKRRKSSSSNSISNKNKQVSPKRKSKDAVDIHGHQMRKSRTKSINDNKFKSDKQTEIIDRCGSRALYSVSSTTDNDKIITDSLEDGFREKKSREYIYCLKSIPHDKEESTETKISTLINKTDTEEPVNLVKTIPTQDDENPREVESKNNKNKVTTKSDHLIPKLAISNLVDHNIGIISTSENMSRSENIQVSTCKPDEKENRILSVKLTQSSFNNYSCSSKEFNKTNNCVHGDGKSFKMKEEEVFDTVSKKEKVEATGEEHLKSRSRSHKNNQIKRKTRQRNSPKVLECFNNLSVANKDTNFATAELNNEEVVDIFSSSGDVTLIDKASENADPIVTLGPNVPSQNISEEHTEKQKNTDIPSVTESNPHTDIPSFTESNPHTDNQNEKPEEVENGSHIFEGNTDLSQLTVSELETKTVLSNLEGEGNNTILSSAVDIPSEKLPKNLIEAVDTIHQNIQIKNHSDIHNKEEKQIISSSMSHSINDQNVKSKNNQGEHFSEHSEANNSDSLEVHYEENTITSTIESTLAEFGEEIKNDTDTSDIQSKVFDNGEVSYDILHSSIQTEKIEKEKHVDLIPPKSPLRIDEKIETEEDEDSSRVSVQNTKDLLVGHDEEMKNVFSESPCDKTIEMPSSSDDPTMIVKLLKDINEDMKNEAFPAEIVEKQDDSNILLESDSHTSSEKTEESKQKLAEDLVNVENDFNIQNDIVPNNEQFEDSKISLTTREERDSSDKEDELSFELRAENSSYEFSQNASKSQSNSCTVDNQEKIITVNKELKEKENVRMDKFSLVDISTVGVIPEQNIEEIKIDQSNEEKLKEGKKCLNVPEGNNGDILLVYNEEDKKSMSESSDRTNYENPLSSVNPTMTEDTSEEKIIGGNVHSNISREDIPDGACNQKDEDSNIFSVVQMSIDEKRSGEIYENATETSVSQNIKTLSSLMDTSTVEKISERVIEETQNFHSDEFENEKNELIPPGSRSRIEKNTKRKTKKSKKSSRIPEEITVSEKNIETISSSAEYTSVEKPTENLIAENTKYTNEKVLEKEDNSLTINKSLQNEYASEIVEKESYRDSIISSMKPSQKKIEENEAVKVGQIGTKVREENMCSNLLVEKQETEIATLEYLTASENSAEVQNTTILGLATQSDFIQENTHSSRNDLVRKTKKPKMSEDLISSLVVEHEESKVSSSESESREKISQTHKSTEKYEDLEISTGNELTGYKQYESEEILDDLATPVCINMIYKPSVVDEKKTEASISQIETMLQSESVVKEAVVKIQDDSMILISTSVNENKGAINQEECDNFDSKTMPSQNTTKQTNSHTREYTSISDKVKVSCETQKDVYVDYNVNLVENCTNVLAKSDKLNVTVRTSEQDMAVVDLEILTIEKLPNEGITINDLKNDRKRKSGKESDEDEKSKQCVEDVFVSMENMKSKINKCETSMFEDYQEKRPSDAVTDYTNTNEIPMDVQVNRTKSFILPSASRKRESNSIEFLVNSKEKENVCSDSFVEPESTVDFSQLRDKDNFFTTISRISRKDISFTRPDPQLQDTFSNDHVTDDAVTTHENLQMEIGHSTPSCRLERKEEIKEIIKFDIPEIDSEVVISSNESSRLQNKAGLVPYVYSSSSDAMPLRQLENYDQQMYAAQDKPLSDTFSCLPGNILVSTARGQSTSQGEKEALPYIYAYNNTADPVIGGSISGEDNYFAKSFSESTTELPPNDNLLPPEFRDIIPDDYKLNDFNESTIKNLSMIATHFKEYDIFEESNDKRESDYTEPNVSMGPWQQMIENDNGQQKVMVTNDQCLTPFFSMSHNDIAEPAVISRHSEESNDNRELDCTADLNINSRQTGPWQQIIENDNSPQKVLVVPNDQCLTPLFTMSESDIFNPFKESDYNIPENSAKSSQINNEKCSPTSDSSMDMSLGVMSSSDAKTNAKNSSSSPKDNIPSVMMKSEKHKKSQKSEKCQDLLQEDFLPTRKYSRTCPAKWIRNTNSHSVSNQKTPPQIKKDDSSELPSPTGGISTDNLLKLPLSKAVSRQNTLDSLEKLQTDVTSSDTSSTKIIPLLDFPNLPITSPLISDTSHPIPSLPEKTTPSLFKNQNPNHPEKPNQKRSTSSLILNNILGPTRDIRHVLAPRPKFSNHHIESLEETRRKPPSTLSDPNKKIGESTKAQMHVVDMATMDIAETVKLRKRAATNQQPINPAYLEDASPPTKPKRRTPVGATSRKSTPTSQPLTKTYLSQGGPVTVTTESEYPLRIRLKVGDRSSSQVGSRSSSDYSIAKILSKKDEGCASSKRPSSGTEEKTQAKVRKVESSRPSNKDDLFDRLKDEGNINVWFSDREARSAPRGKDHAVPSSVRDEVGRVSAPAAKKEASRDFKGRGSGNHREFPYSGHISGRTGSHYYQRHSPVRTGGVKQPTHYPGHNPSHPVNDNAHRRLSHQHPPRPDSYRTVPPQPSRPRTSSASKPPETPPSAAPSASAYQSRPRKPASASAGNKPPDASHFSYHRDSKLPKEKVSDLFDSIKTTIQSRLKEFGVGSTSEEEQHDWIEKINKRVDRSALEPTSRMAQQFAPRRDFSWPK